MLVFGEENVEKDFEEIGLDNFVDKSYIYPPIEDIEERLGCLRPK